MNIVFAVICVPAELLIVGGVIVATLIVAFIWALYAARAMERDRDRLSVSLLEANLKADTVRRERDRARAGKTRIYAAIEKVLEAYQKEIDGVECMPIPDAERDARLSKWGGKLARTLRKLVGQPEPAER